MKGKPTQEVNKSTCTNITNTGSTCTHTTTPQPLQLAASRGPEVPTCDTEVPNRDNNNTYEIVSFQEAKLEEGNMTILSKQKYIFNNEDPGKIQKLIW